MYMRIYVHTYNIHTTFTWYNSKYTKCKNWGTSDMYTSTYHVIELPFV